MIYEYLNASWLGLGITRGAAKNVAVVARGALQRRTTCSDPVPVRGIQSYRDNSTWKVAVRPLTGYDCRRCRERIAKESPAVALSTTTV